VHPLGQFPGSVARTFMNGRMNPPGKAVPTHGLIA